MESLNHSQIKMTVEMPKESWFGLGFGKQMLNTEIMLFLAPADEQQAKVVNTVATARKSPPITPSGSPYL